MEDASYNIGTMVAANAGKPGGACGGCRRVDEDTLRGSRVISVNLEGSDVGGGGGSYVLRRGPSSQSFDSVQTLDLSKCHATDKEELLVEKCRSGNIAKEMRRLYPVNKNLKQDYETPYLPAGQLMKLVIHSSWGDPYYVGLHSVDLIDVRGNIIDVNGVGACPRGLSSIGVSNDSRIPENLVEGGGSHSQGKGGGVGGWLAPLVASLPASNNNDFAPGHPQENVLFFCLDAPQHIAAMRIRNYERTPNRGVRDFSVWIDGQIVYRGFMNRVGTDKNGHIILFCGIPEVLKAVNVEGTNRRGELVYCGGNIQDVLCIDEKVVRERAKFMNEPPDPCAEGVKADLNKRPKTGRVAH